MSTTEAPNGTSLASHARAPISGIWRRDQARLEEYDRLRSSGLTREAAWRKVATSPELGFSRMRPDMTDGRIRRHLAHFLNRVAPERIAAGRRELAEIIPDAVTAIGDIVRGDFGEGRVSIKGRGDDAHEVIEIDAAAASVRSQTARWLLERTSVAPQANQGGTVAVQVNVTQSLLSKLE